MLTDELKDTKILVWDWARQKLNDDLELTIKDNQTKKIATECFREFSVNFPDPNLPPKRVPFFPTLTAENDAGLAKTIQTVFDGTVWHIWVECTQVAAVWTLFRIKELLGSNTLRINFNFTTGHELVKAIYQSCPEDEPQFAVITSAPVHSFDKHLDYRLLSPIHLENQQIFQKRGGVLNKHSRVFNLGWSTAAMQLKRLCERGDVESRGLTAAKSVPSYSFVEFVSWVSKMKGGDCTFLWKPPLWGLNRDKSLVKISDEDFRSPVSLYGRCRNIEPRVVDAFTRLFISKWESNYNTWKNNRAEAFNQFKALIDAWDESSKFLRSFSAASGITGDSAEVTMGVKIDDAQKAVIVDGIHYYLPPRQYDVVRTLARAKSRRLSVKEWVDGSQTKYSQPQKVMQQVIKKYPELKPFYHSAERKGRGYGFF